MYKDRDKNRMREKHPFKQIRKYKEYQKESIPVQNEENSVLKKLKKFGLHVNYVNMDF